MRIKTVLRHILEFLPFKQQQHQAWHALTGRNSLYFNRKHFEEKWKRDLEYVHLTDDHFELYEIIHKKHAEELAHYPDIVNPKTYNDKIAWLMLFDQDVRQPVYTDKYVVREHVREAVGDRYLNNLVAVFDSVDQFDLSALPRSCVIKTNHDSGTVILISDSAQANASDIVETLESSLSSQYGYANGEWSYKPIRPRIIVEDYLGEPGSSPPDFKFHCVEGVVCWLQYIFDRGKETKEISYDRDFNRLPLHLDHNFQRSEVDIEQPLNWKEMVEVAEKLAQGFKYVRVDLYNIDGRVYFGELTFFPMAGCYASDDIDVFGSMLSFDLATAKDLVYKCDASYFYNEVI